MASTTETFSRSGADSFSATPPSGSTGSAISNGYDTLIFKNIENFQGLTYIYITVPETWWQGSETAESTSVSLEINSVVVGTGTFQYNQLGSGDYRLVLIVNDDWDVSGYSGLESVVLDGAWDIEAGFSTSAEMYVDYHNVQPSNTVTFSSNVHTGSDRVIKVTHTGYTEYDFINSYTYYKDGLVPYISVEKYTSPSDWTVETENSEEIHGDTSTNMVDFVASGTPENSTFYLTVLDDYGNTYTDTISFIGTSYGWIELNQSLYTEPELIQIDAGLSTYNFDTHIYRMLMEYSTDDGANWERLSVSFNSTSVISNTTESRTAIIDSSFYLLPIKIRAVIDDYDKTTSTSSTIATSSEVYYNPPSAYDYIVSGTVFNADTGAIIEGALVSASGVTTTSSTSTVTGKFQLYLSEGIYTITTSKSGYQNDVQLDIVIDHDVTWAQIHLVPIGTGNGTLYGNVNDVDTGYAIKDVHVIITNATDSISAYTSSGGYYEATGLAQLSTYSIQAVKLGYYTYNGSVTTEASGASHNSFNMVPETATPTPTATVLPTTTYPGGEGHEWTNDEIVTMLRVTIPGFFLLMLVFLLLAVMLGIGGNNGNSGQGRSGLGELWRR